MFRFILALALLSLTPTLALACASCGCTLSSDWQDPGKQSGWLLDLRYDYVPQLELRTGTKIISPGAASALLNNGSAQEVERYTINNYVTASAEYSISASWKIDLALPYIQRSHSTLGTASDGSAGGAGGGQYTSTTSNLGDARLMARFQGFTDEHNLGLILGVKLPTGTHTLSGVSFDTTAPGPVNIDRGLQPGTGTTDLILGAYYTKPMNKNWDYFTEALYQSAFNVVDQYRPGDGFNWNFGFRYYGVEAFHPQLQVNARYVEHDSGSQSDVFSTGGTLVYLSPGLVVPVRGGVDIYTFMQIPLYQNLLGVQLTPTSTVSAGARYMF